MVLMNAIFENLSLSITNCTHYMLYDTVYSKLWESSIRAWNRPLRGDVFIDDDRPSTNRIPDGGVFVHP